MSYEWMSEWGKKKGKKGKREKEERKEMDDATFSKSKKAEYFVVEKF